MTPLLLYDDSGWGREGVNDQEDGTKGVEGRTALKFMESV